MSATEANLLGLIIFSVIFTYMNWRELLSIFPYKKVFDISFSFFFWGLFTERFMVFLFNLSKISELPWSVAFRNDSLPWKLINLSPTSDFSWVVFLIGGYIGIILYNLTTSTYKVELRHLDVLIRNFYLGILSFYCIDLLVLLTTGKAIGSTTLAIWLFIQAVNLIFFLVAYHIWNLHIKKSGGIFSGLSILSFSFVEIILAFSNTNFDAQVLGIFNSQQILALFLCIIALSITFTGISIKQDQIIRKSIATTKQSQQVRGFAISFANKRRVSNSLNSRFKNFTQNVSKGRRIQ